MKSGKLFKIRKTIGAEEKKAVTKVLNKGILSGFVASYVNDYHSGGFYVKKFENKIKNFFKVKYALTANSWTSGLIMAVGALNIEPGDEIILPTWTMSACSTSIIQWNAIPVFVDICEDDFCINPKLIEEKISKKTKAIMTVDIFGNQGKINEVKKIAKKYKIPVITDSAQSPGSKFKKKYSGTLTEIGGYSLNSNKHIQTGEGGIVVTNNRSYYERMKLIRNHAETVLRNKKNFKFENMIGYNFRLGEIESAIGIEQLKKLNGIVKYRQKLASLLTKKINNLNGLILPKVHKNFSHSYYAYPMIIDDKKIKINRNYLIKKLEKNGIKGLGQGYINLHMLPMFQKKIAYGKKGFPFSFNRKKNKISYKKGICPVAEKLHKKTFFDLDFSTYDLNEKTINFIAKIFKKVWEEEKLS